MSKQVVTAPGEAATRGFPRQREDWLDRGALAASGVCLVHCLLLPIALAMLPALESVAGERAWFHPLLFALIVPTSGLALLLGWIRRRVRVAFLLGLTGVGLLLVGLLVGEGPAETAATVGGSLLLATAHVLNWRSRRCADGCDLG